MSVFFGRVIRTILFVFLMFFFALFHCVLS